MKTYGYVILEATSDLKEVTLTEKRCVDCRVRGGKTKPSDWPNDHQLEKKDEKEKILFYSHLALYAFINMCDKHVNKSTGNEACHRTHVCSDR
jgi:hypothetical protein